MELPTSSSGAPALGVARDCAAEARRLIAAGSGRVAIAQTKGRGNVVTETDLAVERAIKGILGREFPSHAILAEETAATTRADGWMWVLDPIDGTKNFSRGIPHYGFGLALCHNSEPRLAITLHPPTGDEFVAVEREGCTLNGEPCRVSDVDSVRDAVVAFDMGYDDATGARQLATAAALWPGMQSLRITGSAVLGPAFVAAGRWDIYVHRDLRPWDIAGGLLLAREAGGVATTIDGARATIYSESVICATPGVHADFLRLVATLPPQA
ncbi:MAG: inositol monophosphatase family protein [Gemmatimonadales bacterium]